MLGLGSTISKTSKKWDPLELGDNLIGWWDFTDTSNMYQEIDSYTTASVVNGDKIGRIKNKAKSSDKLGTFLRATSDAERPELKRFANKTYAIFDGSDDHLLGKAQASDTSYGGTANGKFSDATINVQGFSIFIVQESDASTVTTDGKIVSIHGTELGDTTEWTGLMFQHDSGTDDFEAIFDYHGDSGDTDESIVSTANLDTDPSLYSLVTESGSNATVLYKNGSSNATGTTAGDSRMVFTNTDTQYDAVIIGEKYRANNGTASGHNFDGNISEVIIVNKTMSTAEIKSMHRYLNGKHGLY